jgi:hypothetical protein
MKKITLLAMALLVAISAAVANFAAAPASQTGTELLNTLPDGKAAIVIDVQRVLSSNLFSQEKLRSLLDKAQNETSQIGVRISDIHAVAISFPSAKFSDPVVAISGTLNQSSILAQLRDKQTVKVETEKYKGFDIQKVTEVAKTDATGKVTSNSHPTAFTFFDANTAVVGSSISVRAAIDARSGERPSLAKNSELMSALSQNSSAPINFALKMDEGMAKGLANDTLPLPNFESLKMIFGAVELTNGVGLNATLRSDTVEHAKAMADQLNSLLAMAKGFLSASSDPKNAAIGDALKSLSVTATEVDVKIVGNLPMDLIGQFLK